MDKLIITATTANSWIYPNVRNWAENDQDLMDDAVQCANAGAAVIHIHLPRTREKDIVSRLRDRTDAIIQAGMSSEAIPDRRGDFEARPDLLSVILNHHAEHFTQVQVDRLHPMSELEQYCARCIDCGIKPEWEVWNTGSYWNLRYLEHNGLLRPPNIVTLFFGWPGGSWSPATADEFFHRVRHMPPECTYTISVMGEDQTLIAMLAIASGGNVRVGTEDWPFLRPGTNAKNNAEIVSRMVRISKELGREIATPAEARRILGLSTAEA
jgi:3-keto-5-aminohexanoate cleavage enzyme